jgi:serine/threonine protein kinase
VLDRLTTALADRYRVERELGHGGMATIYVAEVLKHHRRVAVKVLRAGAAPPPPRLTVSKGYRCPPSSSSSGRDKE